MGGIRKQCSRGVEQKLSQSREEEAQAIMMVDFQAYGKHMDTVSAFK